MNNSKTMACLIALSLMAQHTTAAATDYYVACNDVAPSSRTGVIAGVRKGNYGDNSINPMVMDDADEWIFFTLKGFDPRGMGAGWISTAYDDRTRTGAAQLELLKFAMLTGFPVTFTCNGQGNTVHYAGSFTLTTPKPQTN